MRQREDTIDARTVRHAPPRGGCAASRRLVCALLLALLIPHVCGSLPLYAQAPEGDVETPAAAPVPLVPPKLEAIQAQREAVRVDPSIDEGTRAAILAFFEAAMASLNKTGEFQAARTRFESEANSAPQKMEALDEELSKPAEVTIPPEEELAEASLAFLQAELDKLRADLQLARAEHQRLEVEAEDRDGRRIVIAERLAAITQEQTELADDIAAARAALSPEQLVALLDHPELVADLARRAELDAESAMLAAERRSYVARRPLLPKRVERAARRVKVLGQQVATIEAAATRRNAEQAEAAARAAKVQEEELLQGVNGQYPELRAMAERNAALTASRSGDDGWIDQLEEVQGKIREISENADARREAFRDVLDQVRLVGLSDETGRILREELESLPAPGRVARDLETTRVRLGDTRFRLKRANGELREFQDRAARKADLLGLEPAELLDPPNEDTRRAIDLAGELIEKRRQALDAVTRDLESLSAALETYLAQLQVYLRLTDVFRAYIEERVLWVPSVTTRLDWAEDSGDALLWALGPQSWRTAIVRSWERFTAEWLLPSLALLAIVILLLLRRRMCRISAELAEKVRHHSTDAFFHTWRELAITLLLAVPIPATIALAGVLLASPSDQEPVAIAVGEALLDTALALFVVSFLLRVLRPKGLAEGHLRWPSSAVTSLRRRLRVWLPIIVASFFVVLVFANEWAEERFSATIGRVAFAVLVAGCTMFIVQALRPHGPVLGKFLDRNPTSLVKRMRGLWFSLIVAAPITLGIATAAGYAYTSIELGARMLGTVVFVLLLVLVHAFLLRWLFAARRRLAVEVVRQRARKRAEEAESEATGGTPEGGESIVDEDQIDIPALDTQTKQIFRAGLAVALGIGLYAIWADKLPALHVLERVEIYPSVRWVSTDDAESAAAEEYEFVTREPGAIAAASEPTSTAAGAGLTSEGATGGSVPSEGAGSTSTIAAGPPSLITGASGSESATKEEASSRNVVSLADLGLALLVLFFMVIASRNVPGLLEFSVLQRLPLDRGARYAISTIVRYLIVIIGTTVAFSAIGIGWGRVQWLAAAFTFGLAFGLQEIFANFVSGLIILIERPVRVGDVVTVAGVEGRVTRLQMRSTTIQDWDRREFLIPNKEFITGSLLNWTLTDQVSRLVLVVGCAYGSDTRKAEKTLLRVANECPHTLADPAPNVCFREFGDSTLNFELRIFIPHREMWASATHALHMAIDDAFREEGIEIAFPQRDLHIRSAPAALTVTRGESAPTDHEPPPASATK